MASKINIPHHASTTTKHTKKAKHDNDHDNTNLQFLDLYKVKNSLCSQLRDLGTNKALTCFLFSSLHPRKLSPEFVRKSVARRQSVASEHHHTKTFLVLVSLRLNNEKTLFNVNKLGRLCSNCQSHNLACPGVAHLSIGRYKKSDCFFDGSIFADSIWWTVQAAEATES